MTKVYPKSLNHSNTIDWNHSVVFRFWFLEIIMYEHLYKVFMWTYPLLSPQEIFLLLFLHTNSSSLFIFSSHSSPSIYYTSHLCLREVKAYPGKSYPFLRQNQSPSPTPCLGWARYFYIENGLYKVSSWIGFRSCPTASNPYIMPKPHHCHLYSGDLVQSYVGSPDVSLESVDSVSFPIMAMTPLFILSLSSLFT